ncbi:MAG: FAD-binding oxidoreductase [Hyphomicrobiaceae bacterium]|nr:FAD-binding oxidoreductase [Hyphomicrobiaceae bacterium]
MPRGFDLLVVGGGVLGLWIARYADAAGMNVALADRGRCGCGASGGVLGALMPHMPTGWSPKKQFQFDALCELEDLIRTLEAETGETTGYRRCGRIVPIRKQAFMAEAERRVEASKRQWGTFRHATRKTEELAGWIAADAAPFGVLADDLSARVSPRRLVAALRSAIAERVEIVEGWAFADYNPASGIARASNGEAIRAGRIVLAAGSETFGLLAPLVGATLGAGVKGQAAVLDAGQRFDAQPIIFDNGVYVVAHDDGRVAVGSTTETRFDDPLSTDQQIEAIILRARALSPVLAEAPVIGRWAGLRPKCHERDPIVGLLPDNAHIAVATGGFKITFGIAHRLARWLIEEIASSGHAVDLPPEFGVNHHLSAAAARRA